MECRVLNQQSKRLFTMTRRKGRWRFITTFFFFLSVETPDTLGGGGTHGRLLAVCADVFSTSFFSPAEYEGGNVGEVK
jgi:hypothetical protein